MKIVSLRALRRFVAFLAIAALLPASAFATGKLLQVGTLSALAAGVFDGATTLEPIQRPEAYGLGTFENLDGEMVVLNGVVYQVKVDGSVAKPAVATKIPFAAVSVMGEADVTATLGSFASKEEFQNYVLGKLQSLNHPALIIFEGKLSAVTTRSVPAQKKPYPTLAEACLGQAEFVLGAQEGTLVGFYCPQWMAGLNAPGFHLHFLNSDKSAGGHALSLAVESGTLRIQELTGVQAILPGVDSAFAESDIAPADAHSKAEK
jgi:acetolactate decarboxylase